MKRPSILKKIGAIFLSAAILLSSSGAVRAAKKPMQPIFAYGESLTAQQKQETAKLLGVNDSSLEMQVNIDEMNSLLHDQYHYYQVYSSVYIQPDKNVAGVAVEILTPKTITTITEAQYENAAITAGATNMRIRVASVKAVDGSGALAGVYKAFNSTVGELPEENIKQAQKELTVTSKITEENKEKKGYSDDLLNAAVAEIKAQIAAKKAENNGVINNGTINNIVDSVINNYNLNGILSEENIESLKELMNQFSKLQLSEDQMEALKQFGQKLLKEGNKLLNGVKDTWNSLAPETKSGIQGFFSNIFEQIKNFFQGLFS